MRRNTYPFILYILICIVALSFVYTGCEKQGSSFSTIIEINEDWILRTNMAQDKAEKIVKKFSVIFPYYEELLPFPSKMNRQFKITLFKRSSDFQAYQRKHSMTRSENGFYQFERGELALLYQGMQVTVRTMYHEAFHAYLQERIIHPPQWLNEGLAEYFEKTRTNWWSKLTVSPSKTDWAKTLSRMNRDKIIPHIREIVDHDWPERHNLSKEQYALSWSIVHFLKESGGKKRKQEFNTYLEHLYNKKNAKKAFYSVWTDVDQLNKDWHSSIKKIITKNLFL